MIIMEIKASDHVLPMLEGAPKKLKNGLKQAVNGMAREVKRDIYQGVRQRYTLRGSQFAQKDIGLGAAAKAGLMAVLTVEGETPSLRKGFSARKNSGKMAARAQVLRGGGLKELKMKNGTIKAFVTGVQTGHKGISHYDIFQRDTGSKKYDGRLPIKTLSGPSRAKLSEKVFQELKEKKETELERRIWALAESVMG